MADEDDFVEEELAEGEEGAEEAPKSRKLLWIVLAVLLAGGGGGAYYFLNAGDTKAAEQAQLAPPIYVNLDPPFVVNFEADSLVRFLQITISVMTRDPATAEILKKNDPRIRNDLLMLLGNQRYESISTREGKEALQGTSLEAVRSVVAGAGGESPQVEALYFTAFVMQ